MTVRYKYLYRYTPSSYGIGLRSRCSILWLNGPGGTPTSSFKFCIAKQAFTFAILTLCTPHLRTALHLCNRTEVPVPWRFGSNTCTVTPLIMSALHFFFFVVRLTGYSNVFLLNILILICLQMPIPNVYHASWLVARTTIDQYLAFSGANCCLSTNCWLTNIFKEYICLSVFYLPKSIPWWLLF